jgi:hypothetical protein
MIDPPRLFFQNTGTENRLWEANAKSIRTMFETIVLACEAAIQNGTSELCDG